MTNITGTFVFYCFSFMFSLFFLRLYIKNKEKKSGKIFLFMSIFLLWFINVFRSQNVGADYINVGKAFTGIVLGTYSRTYNWFWIPLRMFCKFIGFFLGSNPFMFYFVLGTIFIIFLYKGIIDNSDNPTMSLFLFISFGLFLQSFNQSRQIVALVIILYSLRYIKQNSFFKYCLTILFASVFHETSLIFLFLYSFKNIKFEKRILLYYLFFIILSIIFEPVLINLVSYTKYFVYFRSQYNISTASSKLNLYVRVIMLVFCLFYRKKIVEEGKIYNYSLHMITICTILQIFTIKYYFLGRLTTYFYAFYIILIPKCYHYTIENLTNNKKIIITILFYLLIFVMFVVYYNSQSGAVGSGYGTYSFVFGG